MKALVLGATGMLGHQVFRVFRTQFETAGTVRGSAERLLSRPEFAESHVLGHCDGLQPATLEDAISSVGPDVVVNCIGIIKQLPEAQDEGLATSINGRLPQQLATLSEKHGFRLIHISTDCVFSGKRGHYTERDFADATDTYGKTKLMGEVTGPRCITLRTSLVGRELERRGSLLEWFLSQAGTEIMGYTQAVFSGVTTLVMARELARLVERFPDLHGLYHVAAEPISKYDLLVLVRDAFGVNIGIKRDEGFSCDRSLDGTKYAKATGFRPPTWPEMVRELADDASR